MWSPVMPLLCLLLFGMSCASATVIDTGNLCGSNDTCAGNGMCLTQCCLPKMTDINCRSCGTNGRCASCYPGCKYRRETGCAAPSPTLKRCHGVGTGPGIATGEMCSSNDTCAGGANSTAMCLTHCCSPLMTDANCHSCGSDGWCKRCHDGPKILVALPQTLIQATALNMILHSSILWTLMRMVMSQH